MFFFITDLSITNKADLDPDSDTDSAPKLHREDLLIRTNKVDPDPDPDMDPITLNQKLSIDKMMPKHDQLHKVRFNKKVPKQ
jgi:hypothetical protein